MFRTLYAVILILTAIFAPPALAANLVAGVVGLSFLNLSQQENPPVIPVVDPEMSRKRYVEIPTGLVMFEEHGDILITRFFRKPRNDERQG